MRQTKETISSEEALAAVGTRSRVPGGACGTSWMASAMAAGPPKRVNTMPARVSAPSMPAMNWSRSVTTTPPEPGGHGVGEGQPAADGQGEGGVPSQQHAAELHHRQHHPAHHDGVAKESLVDRREAAQDASRRATVADLDEFGVGEHSGATPQAGVEEGQHEDAGRLVPPEPVPEDALLAHQRGGGEGRVAGEPGRGDGGARQPPGEGAAGDEVVLHAAACPPAPCRSRWRGPRRRRPRRRSSPREVRAMRQRAGGAAAAGVIGAGGEKGIWQPLGACFVPGRGRRHVDSGTMGAGAVVRVANPRRARWRGCGTRPRRRREVAGAKRARDRCSGLRQSRR